MTRPEVDVIIPIHTAERPIARAVASVLTATSADTRANVVCHNIDPALIRTALGDWNSHPGVRVLSVRDGINSPAGPINAGLDAATAEFTSLLGSDDEYESGAVDAWLRIARRDTADVVIPPLRTTAGGATKSPPTRPGRSRRLDGVRDRLAYRTVQLGLVRRDRFPHLRMTPGLTSGEDVIQGATLWYSGASISMLRKGPGYLIHEDSPGQRVSTAPKPAAESLRFLDAVLDPTFTARLTEPQHEAFAVKLLRTHIMDVLGAALEGGASRDDLDALREASSRILQLAPRAISLLSRRDASILRGLREGRDPQRLAAEYAIRTDYRHPARVFGNAVASSPFRLMHREAPPRFLAATALMR